MIDEYSRLALGVLLAAVHASVWLAHRLGRRARGAGAESVPTDGASALVALLGLLLAFTVSMAVARFEARKQLVVAEANAIGTAALRAQLLPEPLAQESAPLFREYVAGRLRWSEAPRDAPLQAQQERADAALHARLWELAIAAGDAPRDEQHALYVAALNELIDVHSERVHGRTNRVPETVLLLLAAIAVIALAVVGAIHGRNGTRRARDLHALAFSIWLVILLIVDLDQPRRGFIQVGQAPLAALAETLP